MPALDGLELVGTAHPFLRRKAWGGHAQPTTAPLPDLHIASAARDLTSVHGTSLP